jgi:hypothetical protein
LLAADNALKAIDLGQITSSMAGTIVELILSRLAKDDEVVEAVGPTRLIKYWPPALTEWSTKAARDAFFSSPLLPRLLRADAVKRTVADGVSQGLLGYARKDSSGRLVLEKLRQSMAEGDVEIADDVFVLKAEDATKLLDPPKLARLSIRPELVVLKPGERASFTLVGFDQYDQPFTAPSGKWSVTGGEITPEGLYTARETPGAYRVQAMVGGIDAWAEVRVAIDVPPPRAGGQLIQWSGVLPPQKWMHFYTKVLSRFATSPGLRIEVRFEAGAEGAQSRAKVEEARGGLRELGLDDNIQATP